MTSLALPQSLSTPEPHPRLSGGTLALLGEVRTDPLALLDRAQRECGDVARVKLGPVTALALTAPRHVEQVLVRGKDWNKQTRGAKMLRLILGNGLLTAEGDSWRRNRRIANPAFTRRAIGGFAAVFYEEGSGLAARLQGANGAVDVTGALNLLALRIAGRTLFGTDVSDTHEVVSHALDAVLGDFFRFTTRPLWTAHLPLPSNLRRQRAVRALDQVVNELIARRRGAEPQPDLLGMLMAAEDDDGSRMSDVQLRDEVLTMLLAGHETTANALGFTLWLLGAHPGVQEAVQAEVDQLPEGPWGMAEAGRMPLLRQVIQESLRLFPPAWVLARSAARPTPIDGVEVPAGTLAFVSTWHLHRSPGIWPDPVAFRPERWTDGRPLGIDGQPVSPHAWIPFGAGARKCIGSHFAMLELTVVLATLLRAQRFTLAPGRPLEPTPSVTLRPGSGVWLQPQAR